MVTIYNSLLQFPLLIQRHNGHLRAILLLIKLLNCIVLGKRFKRFSEEQGFHSLLRIRTSGEFEIDKSYGHMISDKYHEDLFHIQSCDSWKTFAFDFKQNVNAADRYSTRPYVIQLAFAFSYLPAASSSARFIQRRLRIHTIHFVSNYSVPTLIGHADPLSTILLLNHKVLSLFFLFSFPAPLFL